MSLTKYFSVSQNANTVRFFRFFKKTDQITNSAVAFNKTKRDFFKLQQDLMNTVYFFHSANSLTLKFERCEHKECYLKCDRLQPRIEPVT